MQEYCQLFVIHLFCLLSIFRNSAHLTNLFASYNVTNVTVSSFVFGNWNESLEMELEPEWIIGNWNSYLETEMSHIWEVWNIAIFLKLPDNYAVYQSHSALKYSVLRVHMLTKENTPLKHAPLRPDSPLTLYKFGTQCLCVYKTSIIMLFCCNIDLIMSLKTSVTMKYSWSMRCIFYNNNFSRFTKSLNNRLFPSSPTSKL